MVFPLRQLTKIQTTARRCSSRYYHSSNQTYNTGGTGGGALKNSNAIMQFHQQTQNDHAAAAAAEKNMNHNSILPPNLTFDLKSSFAPSKPKQQLKLMNKNKKNKLPPPPPPTATASSSSLHQQDDLDDEAEAEADDNSNKDKINNGKEIENEYEFGSDEHDDEDDIDIDNAIDTLSSSSLSSSSSFQQHQLRPVLPLPERLYIQILDGPTGKGGGTTIETEKDNDDESVGSIWLEPTVFGIDPIRIDLIKQSVDYIRNKIRGVRTAKSKTISEVSGSGRKVRPQKGGGQARAGHSRPAHWRGGAKAHGPKNTVDYGKCKLNKNVKKIAIRSLLSQKLKEGNLIIVNHLMLDSHKTGPWAKILEQNYGIGKTTKKNSEIKTTTALIVDHYLEPENDDDDDDDNDESSDSVIESDNDYHASYHGVPINLWVATSNIPRVLVRNTRFLNVYDILKKEKLIITLSALNEIENKWKTQ
jgi:large subunit ribosomal protein L4